MRIRSFVLTLLAALTLMFGTTAVADPVPDGPGYAMPAGDAPDASFDTSILPVSQSVLLAEPGGGDGLPELSIPVESGLSLNTAPYGLRSSHYIEQSIAIVATATPIPRRI